MIAKNSGIPAKSMPVKADTVDLTEADFIDLQCSELQSTGVDPRYQRLLDIGGKMQSQSEQVFVVEDGSTIIPIMPQFRINDNNIKVIAIKVSTSCYIDPPI